MDYRFGDFTLDPQALTLRAHGRALNLPSKSVQTLLVLFRRAETVVSKQTLMDALWPGGFVEDGNLTQHIYLLRRAFRAQGIADPIETVPRRGYRFNPPVRRERTHWRAVAACLLLLILTSSGVVRSDLDPQTVRTNALGRYYLNLRSVEGMQRSLGYFRQVTARAPSRALGYSGLADAYIELADFEQPCAQCVAWKRAASYFAAKALAIEPGSAAARTSYAMVARIARGNDTLAEREFRVAIAIDSNYALAHLWLGTLLVAHGNVREGKSELEIAAVQDPVSTATYAWLARANYYERRYVEAEFYAREALALQPSRLETTVLLGLIEEARGDSRDALQTFARVAHLGARTEAEILRDGVYASIGPRTQAIALLRRAAAQAQHDPYAQQELILAYAGASDAPDARAQLAHTHFNTALDRQLLALDPRFACCPGLR
jgi:DNA-binding winged helix-turn-helix (wHTH) protein/Tfp pilus assembly protein PilF